MILKNLCEIYELVISDFSMQFLYNLGLFAFSRNSSQMFS